MHGKKDIVVKEYQAMINKYAGMEYEDVVRQYAEITTGSSGFEMWILDICHRRTKSLTLCK